MQWTIIMYALHIIHNQRTSLRLSCGDLFIKRMCSHKMGNDAVRLVLRTSYYEKAMELEYAAPPVGHFKTKTRWCVCRGDSRICLIGWHGGDQEPIRGGP